MLTKVLWQALLVPPSILGLTLVASISPSLAEIGKTANPDLTLGSEVTTSLELQGVEGSSASSVSSIESSIAADTISSPIETAELQPSLNFKTIAQNKELTPLHTSVGELSQATVTNASALKQNNTQDKPIEFPSLNTEETPVETPNTNTNTNTEETPVETPNTNESQTSASESNRWHFMFQPYVYLPITIYGDTTVGKLRGNGSGSGSGNSGGDIDIGFDEIKTFIDEKLNFLFFGDFQAWRPDYHLGFLANIDYLSASTDVTLTRPVRNPGLADYVPTELKASLDSEVWSGDLAASYRFYDKTKVNPKGVSTEHDLGPLLFDVIGGMNITSVNLNLDLSTNLGGTANFDRGKTIVSPLVGGRVQWNFAPKWAAVTAGSFSGFGISGLTKWSARTGIDWMFAGDTSVGIGYRFSYLNYNKDLDSGKDFGLTLNQNGPYLDFSFRF